MIERLPHGAVSAFAGLDDARIAEVARRLITDEDLREEFAGGTESGYRWVLASLRKVAKLAQSRGQEMFLYTAL
jgi:hypothetical protein